MGQIGESGPSGRTGGSGGSGNPGSAGSGGGSTVIGDTGLPCDVQNVLSARCWSCHAPSTVLPGQPVLVTRADLMAAAAAHPGLTNAQEAVARMQSTTAPMPPAPSTPATSTEIATLNDWIAAGYPAGSCGADAGTAADPFAVAPTCTSNAMWLTGGDGSPSMNPGMACISCHQTSREAPTFTLAGTVYPTAHEPDQCFGANGTTDGAQIVIVGADGHAQTLSPNAAGNFYATTSIALPFQAKVVYMGRERAMVAAQTSGDCNSCHTQAGANGAPGRILLP